MVSSIILQKSSMVSEPGGYTVIPIEYDENTNRLISTSESIKALRKEFSTFDEAIAYSKTLRKI